MSNFFTPFLNFPRYVGTHDLCTNTRGNFSENYRKIYGIIQERRKKIFIFLTDGQFPLALRFLNLQKSYRTKVLTIFFRSSKIFLLIKNTITLGMLLIIMWPIWSKLWWLKTLHCKKRWKSGYLAQKWSKNDHFWLKNGQ